MWLCCDQPGNQSAGNMVRASGGCQREPLFCIFGVGWEFRSAGTYSVTETSAGTNFSTERSYRYSYRHRKGSSNISLTQKKLQIQRDRRKVSVLTARKKKVPVLIPWRKEVTGTHTITEKVPVVIPRPKNLLILTTWQKKSVGTDSLTEKNSGTHSLTGESAGTNSLTGKT